jgi:hypothetical protein
MRYLSAMVPVRRPSWSGYGTPTDELVELGSKVDHQLASCSTGSRAIVM